MRPDKCVGHWQILSRATADSIKLQLNPGEDLEYQMVLPADEQNETIRSGLRCLVKFLMFFFDFFRSKSCTSSQWKWHPTLRQADRGVPFTGCHRKPQAAVQNLRVWQSTVHGGGPSEKTMWRPGTKKVEARNRLQSSANRCGFKLRKDRVFNCRKEHHW